MKSKHIHRIVRFSGYLTIIGSIFFFVHTTDGQKSLLELIAGITALFREFES